LQGWGWVREAQVPGLTLAIWSNVGEAKQPDIHVACWGAWSPMRSNHSYHSHGSCSAGGTQVFHSVPHDPDPYAEAPLSI